MKYIQLFSLLTIVLFSCKPDEPKPENPPENENELITTMILQFKDSANSTLSSFVFRDTDGEGGMPPSRFDTIDLISNRAYFCELLLLDETKTIPDTISNEVLSEADEHLFVFEPDNSLLKISILDTDTKLLPLGLKTRWFANSLMQGKIRIRLKHQPGSKNGSAEPGDTDADLTFAYRIF